MTSESSRLHRLNESAVNVAAIVGVVAIAALLYVAIQFMESLDNRTFAGLVLFSAAFFCLGRWLPPIKKFTHKS